MRATVMFGAGDGDLVVMPFAFSDGNCEFCREGLNTSCVHGGFFGNEEIAGAQAEAVRVPLSDGTLYVLRVGKDDALIPSLLTLSDVMGTGHHAAISAKVGAGKCLQDVLEERIDPGRVFDRVFLLIGKRYLGEFPFEVVEPSVSLPGELSSLTFF